MDSITSLPFSQQLKKTEDNCTKSNPDQSSYKTCSHIRRIMDTEVDPAHSDRKDQHDQNAYKEVSEPARHFITHAQEYQKAVKGHGRHRMSAGITEGIN